MQLRDINSAAEDKAALQLQWQNVCTYPYDYPELTKLLDAYGDLAGSGIVDHYHSRTALHRAVIEDSGPLLRLLTAVPRSAPNVNRTDLNGYTPLHYAAQLNREECIDLLLLFGADATIKTTRGLTALQLLVKDGNRRSIENVLQYAETADKEKAAFIAAQNGRKDVLKIIKANEVSVHAIVDPKGSRPLHVACTGGHEHTADYLLTIGADVNAADQFGNTPLHLAVIHRHLWLVILLLQRGADVQSENKGGHTPLKLAIFQLPDDVLPPSGGATSIQVNDGSASYDVVDVLKQVIEKLFQYHGTAQALMNNNGSESVRSMLKKRHLEGILDGKGLKLQILRVLEERYIVLNPIHRESIEPQDVDGYCILLELQSPPAETHDDKNCSARLKDQSSAMFDTGDIHIWRIKSSVKGQDLNEVIVETDKGEDQGTLQWKIFDLAAASDVYARVASMTLEKLDQTGQFTLYEMDQDSGGFVVNMCMSSRESNSCFTLPLDTNSLSIGKKKKVPTATLR